MFSPPRGAGPFGRRGSARRPAFRALIPAAAPLFRAELSRRGPITVAGKEGREALPGGDGGRWQQGGPFPAGGRFRARFAAPLNAGGASSCARFGQPWKGRRNGGWRWPGLPPVIPSPGRFGGFPRLAAAPADGPGLARRRRSSSWMISPPGSPESCGRPMLAEWMQRLPREVALVVTLQSTAPPVGATQTIPLDF